MFFCRGRPRNAAEKFEGGPVGFGTTNDSKDTNGCDVGVSSSSWFVVRGPWSVVRGPWSVVRGPWSVGRGPWAVVGGWRGLGTGLRLRFRPAGLVSGSPGRGSAMRGCDAAAENQDKHRISWLMTRSEALDTGNGGCSG
jgi:hypothetical protein